MFLATALFAILSIYLSAVSSAVQSKYSAAEPCNDLSGCFRQVIIQGPVVQSVVSLMSSLVIKMLIALVSTISNSQLFLLKKMCHFFSAKILAYMPYLMIKILTIH